MFRNVAPDGIAVWVLEKCAHFYRLCACACMCWNVIVQIKLFTTLKCLLEIPVFVPVSKEQVLFNSKLS
jgi:hypothetical protein